MAGVSPEQRDVARWLLRGEVGAGGVDDEMPLASCVDIEGLFVDRVEPRVRLVGCRPEPVLLAAFDSVGLPTKAAARRRWLRAWVHVIGADGYAVALVGATWSGAVAAVTPSPLGSGLVDVTIDRDPGEPLSSGVLVVLAHWRAGGPVEPNLWADYDQVLRHQWSGVALSYRSREPDRPAGATYHLDGRFVTDLEGFYCAIGEAINGPGGYFGWNLDALDDCLRGGFGAQPPFRLVWHHAAVARGHLVAVDDLLGLFAEHDIEVDLR